MTVTDPIQPVTNWHCKVDLRLISRGLQTIGYATLLLVAAPSNGEAPTNRDAAIQFIAESVGTECTQEVVEQVGLSKQQCDQRHRESVQQCKAIAATDLPALLSQEELGRAMLRFSLCRGTVIQGEEFDLTAWEPTITQMLDKARENE